MADQPLDPQTEERVRRLLAEARHDEPMPPELAARLDGVLADLAAEPAARGRVVRLADRRRRAGALLVAAAAVVVAGIGIGQVLHGVGDSGAEPTSAKGVPAPAGPAVGGAQDRRNGLEAGTPEPTPGSANLPQGGRRALPIRPRHFSSDVRAARLAPKQVLDGVVADGPDFDAYSAEGTRAAGCRTRDWGAGRYVPVTYGRLPGVLVFRKPSGDTQVVDLFLCGARTAVRSTTLPRP